MNEVSPGNIPVHTQLAIRLLHAFEYMENKNPFPKKSLASNRPFLSRLASTEGLMKRLHYWNRWKSGQGEGPLLAESGSQNLVIPAFLTSASPPKADVELISSKRAANDPKRTSLDANPGATNPLYPPLCCRPVAGAGMLSLLEKGSFSKAYGQFFDELKRRNVLRVAIAYQRTGERVMCDQEIST